jgi:hypothetical protein
MADADDKSTAPPADMAGIDRILGQMPAMTKEVGKLSGSDESVKALTGVKERQKTAAADYQSALGPSTLPPEPKLRDMPTRPDTTLQNPAAAFQEPATILAIFGSLLTRAPLTSALNAASGAMNGYRQGNLDQAKQLETKFHDDLDIAIKQNTVENDRYKIALNKRNATIQEKQASLEALAVEFKDEQVLQQIKAGNFDEAVKIIQTREAMAARMQNAQFLQHYRMQALQERTRHDEALEMARGGLTPSEARKNVAIDHAKADIDEIMADPQRRKVLEDALKNPTLMLNSEQKYLIDRWKLSQEQKFEPRGGGYTGTPPAPGAVPAPGWPDGTQTIGPGGKPFTVKNGWLVPDTPQPPTTMVPPGQPAPQLKPPPPEPAAPGPESWQLQRGPISPQPSTAPNDVVDAWARHAPQAQ